jgi:rRNA maturation endonuclease Nob1
MCPLTGFVLVHALKKVSIQTSDFSISNLNADLYQDLILQFLKTVSYYVSDFQTHVCSCRSCFADVKAFLIV